MSSQPTRNLSQGCVIWQEMQKGYHQSRPKRTMTNMLSAVFCSDLALSEKSIRQRERFCSEILREIQHSATENKDKMTWGVGADRCPFSMEKQLGQLVADDLSYSYRAYIENNLYYLPHLAPV